MAKVAVLGVGRMGKGIIAEAVSAGMQVVAAVDAPASPQIGKDAGMLAGISLLNVLVSSAADLEKTLDKTKPDVVIDFSSADACIKNFPIISWKGVNVVIGTTGLKPEQLEAIKADAKRNNIGVVISPNMSVGVNVFWKIIAEATKNLRDYDVEIIEKHHRFKKDAPSGTALKTAEIISKELNKDLVDNAVYGRHGLSERKAGEIGIHAIRGGDIVGEHTVMYTTLGERIEITHIAHSRGALIGGAIKAAKFIAGKKGVYGMNDVLGI
jgi:4-hydroxy-tetrahydrodipicolinate reductase